MISSRMDINVLLNPSEGGQRGGSGSEDKDRCSEEFGDFDCDKCGKRFHHKCSLVRHVKSIHLHERQHVCEQCNRSFGRRDNLRTHIIAVHDRRNTVSCQLCGKVLATYRSLKHHLKQIHDISSRNSTSTSSYKGEESSS
mmetsp:Transcript_8169/g.24591  ORF Transcript_8169/g.24591 Transcript_8169/m.24591 type:complete len:140 (+) Transcript_8169:271-690(+)